MRIVIVGAGAVGSYLAKRLALEGQDIALVESNEQRALEVQSEIDCIVVNGNGASSSTLVKAGLADADLLIAVSSSDAINVLACSAATAIGIPRTVARVEDPELKAEVEELGVDFIDTADSYGTGVRYEHPRNQSHQGRFPRSVFAHPWTAPDPGVAAKTASLRRYGPPSAVWVVSMLAKLLEIRFIRSRWALNPDALVCSESKKLMVISRPLKSRL